jgi:hypothetical protein
MLLDGGRQQLALRDREAKASGHSVCFSNIAICAVSPGAVFDGDFKKNLHAHGDPRS